MRRIAPQAMEATKHFQGEMVRTRLLERGFLSDNIVRYCYRPFDMRWLYWEPETNLLAHNRPSYRQQPFHNNLWLEMRPKVKGAFDRGYVVHTLADGFGPGVSRFFPLYLNPENKQFSYFETDARDQHPNLTVKAMVYAQDVAVTAPHLFYHAVTMLHTPAYHQEYEAILGQGWPHLPLPSHKQTLRKSAILGQKLVMLLNPEIKVSQVTSGPLRPDLAVIGVLRSREEVTGPDWAITAGWSQGGPNYHPLPGPGLLVARDYTAEERAALEKGAATLGLTVDQWDGYLGTSTYDIYLNETTYWANIPAQVWDYTMSGYAVLQKWLSYREQEILYRPLRREEGDEFSKIARRIAAIRLMTPVLNHNYQAVKQATYLWPQASHPLLQVEP
jgi:hypothetical protein